MGAPVLTRPLVALLLSATLTTLTSAATRAAGSADEATPPTPAAVQADDEAGPVRAVTMLPLVAGDTITSKSAKKDGTERAPSFFVGAARRYCVRWLGGLPTAGRAARCCPQ